MTLEAVLALGLGMANTGLLTGIFLKLGGIEAQLENHHQRLQSIELLHPRRELAKVTVLHP